jgi:hypothetical protein
LPGWHAYYGRSEIVIGVWYVNLTQGIPYSRNAHGVLVRIPEGKWSKDNVKMDLK